MKIILVVMTLFTVIGAQAESANSYNASSSWCERAAKDPDFSQYREDSRSYRLTADFSEITISTNHDGQTEDLTYNLTQAGKNAYIAAPAVAHGAPKYFFVAVTEGSPEVLIYSSDMAETVCGGGLIVTKISR